MIDEAARTLRTGSRLVATSWRLSALTLRFAAGRYDSLARKRPPAPAAVTTDRKRRVATSKTWRRSDRLSRPGGAVVLPGGADPALVSIEQMAGSIRKIQADALAGTNGRLPRNLDRDRCRVTSSCLSLAQGLLPVAEQRRQEIAQHRARSGLDFHCRRHAG